jgi:NitT/TauT family transport system permease protein
VPPLDAEPNRKTPLWHYVLFGLVLIGLAYGAFEAGKLLITIPLETWGQIALGAGATLLRILASVTFALLWTIPVGVWIGTNPDAARIMQPVVQVIASVPATALFPVLLLGLLNLPMGGDIAAVLLMMLGTQWYILFNVIAGASAIPQDLKYSSDLLQVRGWRRWRTLILPAVFPYIVTGVITASGGAWNASIVAEYANLGERTSQVFGLGSLIAAATVNGDYALMLAAALTMIVLVVLFNRFIWMRLLRVAENRFRID